MSVHAVAVAPSRTLTLVQRHTIATFFALTHAGAWSLWMPLVVLGDRLPAAPGFLLALLGSCVPSTVGVLVIAVLHGKQGVRALLGRLVKGRVALRWYLAVLVLPLVSVIAASVIITWMYNSTGGSLLIVVLYHAAANLPLTLLITPLGDAMTQPFLIYTALIVAVAVAVVAATGPEHLSRTYRKPVITP